MARSMFWQRPATRPGRLAAGLGAAFLVLFLINSFVFMPLFSHGPEIWWQPLLTIPFGFAILLSGLASGILAWFALVRRHERSWMVCLALLPGAFMLFFLFGEFLQPH